MLIQDSLTAALKKYAATAKEQVIAAINLDTPTYWAEHGGYLQPFKAPLTGAVKTSSMFPKPC